MIVNHQAGSMVDTPIVPTVQCENFLKRKITQRDDNVLESGPIYGQPNKKRLLLQNTSENSENISDLSYNMNNSVFLNDFFNYETNLLPSVVPTSTPIYSGESYEASWQSTNDILELDGKYNAAGNLNQTEDYSQQRQDDVEFQMQSRDSASPQLQAETDFEDKNLSWLFNFKLDELPHLSPEIRTARAQQNQIQQQLHQNDHPVSPNSINRSSPKSQSRTGKKFEELVMEVTANESDSLNENNSCDYMENCSRMPKKPPFTYTELIEYALEDKSELTVSGIYQWISDRFPFYKSNDDRWKNSVRHNLSINPHFRKGVKAPQGAGHLWTISSADSEENILAWEHKKQRLELFFKMESLHREREMAAIRENANYDEAAAAVAAITKEYSGKDDRQSPTSKETDIPTTLSFTGFVSDDEIKKNAGDILNGIRRDVEVQAINSLINTYGDAFLEGDYGNPLHKEVSRAESSYYVTEIDPIELGVNIGNVEEEVLLSDEFNLNYFGINSANDIVTN
ncbi:hypothetical protein ACFFRR_001492 [Megaselia abdita]